MANMLKHQEMFTHLFEDKKILAVGFKGMGVLLMAFSITGDFLPLPVRLSALLIGIFCFLRGRHAAEEGHSFFDITVRDDSATEAMASLPREWARINNPVLGRCKIDRVVVCPKGVYVIKTQNFGGTIDGSLEERTWCRISPEGERSIFFNPIKEVLAHAAELQRHLRQSGFHDVKVKPVLVFTKPVTWLRVLSSKVPIVRVDELGDMLRTHPHIMMPEKCAEIAKRLESLASTRSPRKRLPGRGEQKAAPPYWTSSVSKDFPASPTSTIVPRRKIFHTAVRSAPHQ